MPPVLPARPRPTRSLTTPTSNIPPVQVEGLSPKDEENYRIWMHLIGQTPENGMNVTPDMTGTDYDYRGFYKKYGPADVTKGQHFTDEFKLPSHPTFSQESQYAQGPYKQYAGTWQGEKFTPGKRK